MHDGASEPAVPRTAGPAAAVPAGGVPGTRTKRRGGGFIRDVRRNPVSYLLALPAILYTLVFGYATLPYLMMAFQKFSYDTSHFWQNPFIGFKNFEFFFRSDNAVRVTWNTIRLNFLFIAFGNAVAVLLAVIMNEVRGKWFLRVSQSLFLFPYFLSWVIVSYVVYNIFSSQYGLLNQILEAFGMKAHNWYGMADAWPGILAFMRVWKDAGLLAVIFLAAIVGIDNELYEAARIDGASRWQQIRGITLPLLMPTVVIMVLLAIGKIFYGDFAMMYAIIHDNGLLLPTTDVIDTYVYRALRMTGDPAQAMAVGIYQAVMGFLLVYGVNRLIRRYFPEGALF
ncbi:sugar ABC transporter permease [Paenibacillus sp. MWE-103]|uniref:Sugar ABC transporter permease n=1 Tax=Paenibacillus artemisiicola TaxID=1172618 RepID=A0ABS3WKY9_9BACL|nr:ABC transporter permease subunit [Paenibacillus artemisiicola]MBO7748999.1 sugar ABC transporter permease [Paenibacillus artemisiicola]